MMTSDDGYLDAPLYAPSRSQLDAEGTIAPTGRRAMTISDEAVEAAAASFFAGFTRVHPQSKADMRAALEAAAPFIRAEALEEAADDVDGPLIELRRVQGKSFDWLCGLADAEGRLRARAAEMRQG